METKEHVCYLTPEIEVVEVAIEMGFEGSSNVEDPMEDPTQGWY